MRFSPAHPAPVIATTSMDRTTSFLIAMAVLLSGVMSVLLAIWVLNLETQRPVRFGGGNMGIEVFAGTPTPPVAQEVTSPEEVTDDPSARISASDWAELVQLIERVSSVDAPLVDEPPGGMAGSGPGSDGTAGDVITVPPTTIRPERWTFVINGIANLREYAQMLQQFRIEVGTFDNSNNFAYLENVTRSRPTIRRPSATRDERFFTVWQSGSLVKLDAQLFRNAGIESRDGQFVHFFSAQLEQKLAALEQRATRTAGRKSRDIRRTWFAIEKTDAGFRFRVARQQWSAR